MLTTTIDTMSHLVAFGRILWSEANEYSQEILLREGCKPIGFSICEFKVLAC